MFKKFLCTVLALCAVITFTASSVFAKNEQGEIKAAMKAIKDSNTAIAKGVYHDMTADEFLKMVSKFLPEGSSVTLSISKETDYRLFNASSEKDGTLFVNILFTCDPYTQPEMFDFKLPRITGDAAISNADNEKIDADKLAVAAQTQKIIISNDSTKESILADLQPAIKNGSTITWENDFKKQDATEHARGIIKGTLRFTLNSSSSKLEFKKLIPYAVSNASDVKNNDTAPTEITSSSFEDVPSDAYYADAVKWAVGKKITAGTSNTTFSPDDTCTRAQILTFLWRAVGSPEPNIKNPFSDVKESDYFYKAALWASENGMVLGSVFAGSTPCTRSATVTYLWQNAEAPDPEDYAEFSDVSADSEYADAVAWAVENSVTSGTSDTTFSPDAICSRGQIVTFLKRALD